MISDGQTKVKSSGQKKEHDVFVTFELRQGKTVTDGAITKDSGGAKIWGGLGNEETHGYLRVFEVRRADPHAATSFARNEPRPFGKTISATVGISRPESEDENARDR